MLNVPPKVLSVISRHTLLKTHDHVLAAVSGGPDSVALLEMLARLRDRYRFTLGAAYFDHGLRPRETPAEAGLVEARAATWGIPFYQGRGQTRDQARERRISVQMAARELRHAFLEQVRRTEGYDKIALGHTADDQVELFFLRLLRGAGPEGLGGMPPATATGIIRPLLGLTKAEVLAWLEGEGLDWCRDSSNLSRRYRRNRLRLDLLPELARHYNPRLTEAVARTQELLREEDDFWSRETVRLLAEWGVGGSGPWSMEIRELLGLHPALARRVLRKAVLRADPALAGLNCAQVEAALHLGRRPRGGGETALPGGWRLVREGGRLRLTPPGGPAADAPGETPLPPGEAGEGAAGGWIFTWRTLTREAAGEPETASPRRVWLDREQVTLPLRVRPWRPGDRFRPRGMTGTKKLQDLFVDAKVPRGERGRVPLVLSRGEIIWVVGLRLAESVGLKPETATVLILEARPE